MAKKINETEDPSIGPEGEKLIPVGKDGETIFINPSTLDSHREAGWKIAEA